MNKDTWQGKWHEMKGQVKKQWGKLTDSDLTIINGKREELLGKLQQRYGYEKEKAEGELKRFEKSVESQYEKNHAGQVDKKHSNWEDNT